MDSVFGIFFGALAIIAFGACIGAGLRGRPGRLFGLAILKIGLVCLFVLLLFVDSFPHNEIILWLVLMLNGRCPHLFRRRVLAGGAFYGEG